MGLVLTVAGAVGGGAIWHDAQMEAQASRINGEWQRQLQTADTVYERELKSARQIAITLLNDQRKDCMTDRVNQREANTKAVMRLLEIMENALLESRRGSASTKLTPAPMR